MPGPHLEGMDINDAFRIEQKVGMALFLDRSGQNFADYKRRQELDPMNVEFNSMPVLKVSLVLPKHRLIPILDQRVF